MIETYYWTWFTVLGYVATFVGNYALIGLYCAVIW